MNIKSCIQSAMEYVDGLCVHFQAYLTDTMTQAIQGPQVLSVEDTQLIAGAMISTILAILNREATLDGVKKMTALYNKVASGRTVYGADFNHEGHEGLGYGGAALTAAERAEATEVKALKQELSSWWWEVYGACNDVGKLPESEQTADNLRSAFLRHVSHRNVVRPPEEQLDFQSLNISFSPV